MGHSVSGRRPRMSSSRSNFRSGAKSRTLSFLPGSNCRQSRKRRPPSACSWKDRCKVCAQFSVAPMGIAPPSSRYPTRINVSSFAIRQTRDRLLVRNLKAEKEALARLEQAGFAPAVDTLELRDSGRIVRFFAFDYPALPRSWNISRHPAARESESRIGAGHAGDRDRAFGRRLVRAKVFRRDRSGRGDSARGGATPSARRAEPGSPNEWKNRRA